MSKEQEAHEGAPPAYSGPPQGYAAQQQYPQGQYPAQQGQYPPQQGQYPPQQQAYYPSQGYPAPSGYHAVHAPHVVVVANQPLQGPIPDDYCTYSILNTIFCCFWIGIFAIIKSQNVRDAVARGDRHGAETASKDALKMNKIALGVGIACTTLYIVAITLYCLFIVGYFW